MEIQQGDIIVKNDNFGTRRKYADFTEGKKKANLHPLQIVFSGLEILKRATINILIKTIIFVSFKFLVKTIDNAILI